MIIQVLTAGGLLIAALVAVWTSGGHRLARCAQWAKAIAAAGCFVAALETIVAGRSNAILDSPLSIVAIAVGSVLPDLAMRHETDQAARRVRALTNEITGEVPIVEHGGS